MTSAAPSDFDYVLVGGGLSSALLALALFRHRPKARVALVERDALLGGNHLWCFHAGDVGPEHRFVEPLVTRRWPRYEVRFPQHERVLDEPYCAVTSERLDRVVRSAFGQQPGSRLFLSRSAERVEGAQVTLEGGEVLHGGLVLEGRGPSAFPRSSRAGYQKFLGLELMLRRPSRLRDPVLMDARVPQRDGFRFMYALPLESDRLLLEDTYFSDSPALDQAEIEREIMAYAAELGCEVDRVARREVGCLPLPTRMPQWQRLGAGAPLVTGYQGGWFHPLTGYSFPVAVRLAHAVATAEPKQLRSTVWPALEREHRSQFRFAVLLNRLLFSAFAPEERWGAIERFYRMPSPTVRRFYALTLTRGDRLRLLCGRPPRGFSFPRALSWGWERTEAMS